VRSGRVRTAAVSVQKHSNAKAVALGRRRGLLSRRHGTDIHEVYASSDPVIHKHALAQVFGRANHNEAEMSAALTIIHPPSCGLLFEQSRVACKVGFLGPRMYSRTPPTEARPFAAILPEAAAVPCQH
jgi:hypothetical protein